MKESARMFKWSILLGILLMMAIVIGFKTTAIADVSVGDVVDKSNWQKVQGLLPDAMLDYLKKGYYTIKVGKLNYDPADMLNPEFKESMTKNIGRYGLTSTGEQIDKKTGVVAPMDEIGIPFPVLDLKDPEVALKMLSNHVSYLNSRGNMSMTATLYFIGQKMERYIAGPQQTFNFSGAASAIKDQPLGVKEFGNPKLSTLFIMKVTDPYELNGLVTMTHGFADTTPDKVFAYVPALRRARVLTSSAKSDSMFGTDYALDDAAGGFMGNPRDFHCKYIRTQDTLVRFNSPDLIGLDSKPDGTYDLSKNRPNAKWGFQTPGWTGKAWATTNQIWIKRKVHVIECVAKDPYYNYGKTELWYDPDDFMFAHKTIWDRAGKRWKVMNMGFGGYASKDGQIRKIDAAFCDWIYDEQRDHATGIDEFNSKEKKQFHAHTKPSDFTLGGLVKYAK